MNNSEKVVSEFSRRDFLRQFAALGLLLKGRELLADTSSAKALLSISLPDDIMQSPSYEAFMVFSRFLTNRDSINPEFSRKLYTLILNEPWSAKHFNGLLGFVRSRISSGIDIDLKQLMTDKELDDGERWFAGHLLFSWYSGVYHYDDQHERLTFQHALMNVALGKTYSPPTYSQRAYGFWAKPEE